jgi:hypothetical protein
VVGLHSCGSDNPQTCLERVITYSGSKSGAAYSRVASDDGGRSFFLAGNAVSIRFLILAESGSVTCFGGGEHIDIPFTAVAWIDVAGTAAANCSDTLHPQPQCQPSPSDPQAHQKAVLRFGQLTPIRLDVVDPP